jgi:hypothetical protein
VRTTPFSSVQPALSPGWLSGSSSFSQKRPASSRIASTISPPASSKPGSAATVPS